MSKPKGTVSFRYELVWTYGKWMPAKEDYFGYETVEVDLIIMDANSHISSVTL